MNWLREKVKKPPRRSGWEASEVAYDALEKFSREVAEVKRERQGMLGLSLPKPPEKTAQLNRSKYILGARLDYPPHN